MRSADLARMLRLGLPTFGMALAVTVVSTYLPVVARGEGGSTTVIGLIIGAEGVMALWLPVLAGTRSDRLRTPLGGRLPFVLAGAPVMALCLVALGLLHSLLAMGLLVGLFFAGYFVAYEPYRALYPDLVPDELAGRSQSVQAGCRGLGTGLALISGGALLSLGVVIPFAAAAALLLVSIGAFVALLLSHGYRERLSGSGEDEERKVHGYARAWALLRRSRELRLFLFANALWELALGAIKTFVVLYVTAGLGYSLGQASLIIGAVAVIILLGALASGRLGDRYGRARVVEYGLWVYGITLLVPGLTTQPAPIIAAVPFVAVGGGMLMSLPYSLLMPLMPDGEHGALTGLYSLSRGLGVMLGPLLAGVAIQAGGSLFSSTQGYAAAWWVSGVAILLSLFPLRRLRRVRDEPRGGSRSRGRRRSGPRRIRARR